MSAKHLAILEARRSGKSLKAVAKEFSVAWSSIRRIVLVAEANGIEAVMQMKENTSRGKPRKKLPEDAYNARWLERVRRKTVIDANGCHLWQGWRTGKGYGATTYRGRNVMIHRQVYKIVHKVELAEEQFVCHSCDVKACWNPDHTWLGDNGLNKKDETAKGTNFWAKKTHCPRNHEYTPENTSLHQSKPGVWSRGCKTCERERAQSPEYKAKALERQRRKRAILRAQKMGASHVQS